MIILIVKFLFIKINDLISLTNVLIASQTHLLDIFLCLISNLTHNLFLMQQIQKTSTAEICIPSDLMIDYKEAMIFGFLGLLKYCGVDNCFASVTGARHNHSTGVIFEHN